VRASEQRGAVPDAAIGIGLQGVGQRLMRAAALRDACAVSHGRAHERMAEPHRPDVELDDPRLRGRLQHLDRHRRPADEGRGGEDLGDVVLLAQSSDEEQHARLVWQLGDAGGERALELRGQGQFPSRGVVGVPARRDRQFQERERVAGGLAQDAGANGRGEHVSRCLEQRDRRIVVETIDPVLGKPGGEQRRVVPVTGRGEEDDRVGVQASRDEREHVRARPIEPVGVLCDQQDRSLLRDLREQVERGHGDAEVLGRGAVDQAERPVERGLVHRGQIRRAGAHRAQELMQTRETQAGFGLNSRRRQDRDAAFACGRHRLGEQAGLTDPRFAPQHECGTAVLDAFQQGDETLRLDLAAKERAAVIARRSEHERKILPRARRQRHAEPPCSRGPCLAPERRARGTQTRLGGAPMTQTAGVTADVALMAVSISWVTASGCESAIECDASTSIVSAPARRAM
jgi:hypothetical protein